MERGPELKSIPNNECGNAIDSQQKWHSGKRCRTSGPVAASRAMLGGDSVVHSERIVGKTRPYRILTDIGRYTAGANATSSRSGPHTAGIPAASRVQLATAVVPG